MSDVKERLNLVSHPAKLYTKLENGEVICHLSPRQCRMKPGQAGFCRVRKNENGELVTLNYGVSVQLTQEMIETEAVVHHSPGQPILSLGNIGCMLNCDFCHYWQTSQVRFVKKKDIQRYTPEQVVETALRKGINILSWTYNDPVVWHEFVCDTAKLAHQYGLLNLYKSAFYISPQAIEELHEVIDIFSLSLKSMDPSFYRRVAKGRLEPVLEGIKQVYSYGDRHLEISNLIVTGMNDSMDEVDKVIRWILKELDETVPLHFVRFHPDYKYTHVERTNIEFLKKARLRALEMGIKHCYLGNVYEEHEGLNTFCGGCGNLLVKRFGLQTQITGINEQLNCAKCGLRTPIKFSKTRGEVSANSIGQQLEKQSSFSWNQDINACHVILENLSAESRVVVSRQGNEKIIKLNPSEQWRFICSKQSKQDEGVLLLHSKDVEVKFVQLLDRAHYPV